MADLDSALELAVKAGAIRALRTRAAAKREEARCGVTNGEGPNADVIIIASEARAALNIANDLAEIADELEAGGML
jgi:hypothetical protein